jgi:hypothetical protein
MNVWVLHSRYLNIALYIKSNNHLMLDIGDVHYLYSEHEGK